MPVPSIPSITRKWCRLSRSGSSSGSRRHQNGQRFPVASLPAFRRAIPCFPPGPTPWTPLPSICASTLRIACANWKAFSGLFPSFDSSENRFAEPPIAAAISSASSGASSIRGWSERSPPRSPRCEPRLSTSGSFDAPILARNPLSSAVLAAASACAASSFCRWNCPLTVDWFPSPGRGFRRRDLLLPSRNRLRSRCRID